MMTEPTNGGMPVLVVDDDSDIREAMVEILEAAKYPVVSAADGQEALTLLAGGLVPGLILLDLMMPVVDGFEVLARMSKQPSFARIPVVALSASRDISKALNAGAVAVLSKPYELTALRELVRLHLRKA